MAEVDEQKDLPGSSVQGGVGWFWQTPAKVVERKRIEMFLGLKRLYMDLRVCFLFVRIFSNRDGAEVEDSGTPT